MERATRWLINNRRQPIDIGAAVEQFAAGVQAVAAGTARHLDRPRQEALDQRLKSYQPAGVPDELARDRGAASGVRGADHRADRRPQSESTC